MTIRWDLNDIALGWDAICDAVEESRPFVARLLRDTLPYRITPLGELDIMVESETQREALSLKIRETASKDAAMTMLALLQKVLPGVQKVTFVHRRKKRMRVFVKLYRDGDDVAIQTNATNDADFAQRAALALAEALDSPKRQGRVDALLGLWLPQVIDVACKLRGYKAPTVDEQRLLTAGRIYPSESLVVAASEANGIDVPAVAVAATE